MKFEQYYSSSFGNLYMVTFRSGKRLMLECGVTWKKLQQAINYNLKDIEACLITHEHADHSKAVRDVLKAGIDVNCSHGTFEALGLDGERRVGVVADKTLLRFNDFEVYCFNVNHDAAEPIGFVVREKATNEYLLFATDTSHINQQFKYPFSIIAIECSYDKAILQERVKTGSEKLKAMGLPPINETLAKRLLTSHMEKTNTINYINEFCDLSRCREIHLLHLSGDNLNKKQCKIDFEKKFFIETRSVKDDEVQGTYC